jgi:hypothetical protein
MGSMEDGLGRSAHRDAQSAGCQERRYRAITRRRVIDQGKR